MAFEQTACPKCGSSLVSLLYCFSCENIQSFPKEIDYFQALGFASSFEVDLAELEERYQKLSLEVHPDYFISASDTEKLLSEEASAVLNRAYKTLREPNSRAGYLLQFCSKKEKLDERSLPEGFLREMFFLQESLDELKESGKESELLNLKESLILRKKEIEAVFSPLFKKLENFPNDSETLQKLQTNLNAERYLSRILERIN